MFMSYKTEGIANADREVADYLVNKLNVIIKMRWL
jgi:hypothetical protein